MPYQLGRRPADPDRPVLRLADYLTGAVPEHPPFTEYLSHIATWELGSNDRFGTCGPTSVANQLLQVTTYLEQAPVRVTDEDIFNLYRAAGNPQFDPGTGADDNGVNMADMLSALLKIGLAGRKPVAYAKVQTAEPEEVRAAIALFGSVLFGLTLDKAQEQQIDSGKPWDYVRRSPEWGGHAVMAGGYTSQTGRGSVDVSVVTWGKVQGCTDDFLGRQLDEAWVVIWPELLGTVEFQSGVNVTQLAADYTALTGRPFPAAPAPPKPSPTPRPTGSGFPDQLRAFMKQAQDWLDTQKGTEE